jgi:transcriptional regulator with XRE-family HTH domain
MGNTSTPLLQTLGERIRAHRKQLRLSAIATAEAAGLSRVTLHRIEKGEPTVAIGAYLAVLDALGLRLDVVDPQARPAEPALPERIALDAYPQLRRLAWQTHAATELTPAEALNLYERHWRHLDPAALSPAERALVQQLVWTVGGGRLLV